MTYHTWRDGAAPTIRKVLAETKGQDMKAIRKALREAYPYGERRFWPYKIWCDEIRRQLGLKKPPRHEKATDSGQLSLLAEQAKELR